MTPAQPVFDEELLTVITFKNVDYPVTVKYASNQDALHNMLRYNAEIGFAPDAIAYSGDDTIYLIRDASIDTRAHEATHMALTILAKSGVNNLTVTADDADENEEDFCSLVGCITDWLSEFLLAQSYQSGYAAAVGDADDTLRRMMNEYADMPLSERPNAFDYMAQARDRYRTAIEKLEQERTGQGEGK